MGAKQRLIKRIHLRKRKTILRNRENIYGTVMEVSEEGLS